MEQFDPEALGPMLVVAAVMLAISLAIAVVVCLIISNALGRVPQTYRQMEPGLVWLLLIPCFSLIWNFFVFPKVSRSFRACLEARSDTSQGDCGEKLGWWYAGCSAASLIPCVGYVTMLAALVLLVLLLVKFNTLKNLVGGGGTAPSM